MTEKDTSKDLKRTSLGQELRSHNFLSYLCFPMLLLIFFINKSLDYLVEE